MNLIDSSENIEKFGHTIVIGLFMVLIITRSILFIHYHIIRKNPISLISVLKLTWHIIADWLLITITIIICELITNAARVTKIFFKYFFSEDLAKSFSEYIRNQIEKIIHSSS